MDDAQIGTEYSQDGYEVIFATEPILGVGQPSIQLVELTATSSTSWDATRLDYEIMDPTGWHHVDVTRDARGYFCVYLNNTLILEAVDTTVTTTSLFAFAYAGAFDNVVVSNTIDIDLAGPRYIDEPTDQIINEGEEFRYVINATDVHYVDPDSWTVNDTANFVIGRSGILHNATVLSPGVYGLEVSVSDSPGNTRTAIFSVTVLPAVFDPTLLVVGGGIAAVVVIVVLVIFLKKRT
jgi:hypothetical protein